MGQHFGTQIFERWEIAIDFEFIRIHVLAHFPFNLTPKVVISYFGGWRTSIELNTLPAAPSELISRARTNTNAVKCNILGSDAALLSELYDREGNLLANRLSFRAYINDYFLLVYKYEVLRIRENGFIISFISN